MEHGNFLLVIWGSGGLLLLSLLPFNCRACHLNFPAEVLSIQCLVKYVVIEFLQEEYVVLSVGILGAASADATVDRMFKATL